MNTRKLMHEGLPIGTRIRAYDFRPVAGARERYIEGEIVGTRTHETMRKNGHEPFACYVVVVQVDTLFPAGERRELLVPFETRNDYPERVQTLPALPVQRSQSATLKR